MADDKIRRILMQNAQKPFVQRILNRDKFPTLTDDVSTRGGSQPDRVSTHSMAWGEVDGRYVAYPTVMMSPSGQLRRYGAKEALGHALNTGNFIEFDTPEDADWFSRNYKQVWK
jgi:hypothetical protein